MPFPVDIRFVNQAEAKLGRTLPAGYVAKMCRENGGEVTTPNDHSWLFPIFDDSDKKRLKRTCNDIIRETLSSKEWLDYPADALAIGHNGGGDKLILLTVPDSNRFSDSVYWWDHETGEIIKVAEDFDELSD